MIAVMMSDANALSLGIGVIIGLLILIAAGVWQ